MEEFALRTKLEPPFANHISSKANIFCIWNLLHNLSNGEQQSQSSVRAQALRLEPPHTGVPRPSGPEIHKKSQKGLPAPPRPECQKSVEKSLKGPTRKRGKKVSKSVFGDFFGTFLTLWAGRPGKTFFRLFGDFGLGGVESPVYGVCNRKASPKHPN